MQNQMIKRSLLALLIMLAAAGGAHAQELVIAPGEPITIGVMTALPNYLYAFGSAIEQGVLLSHEERPSLHFGDVVFPVELDRYNSACSAGESAAAAANLVQEDRAVAIIGPNCTSACGAAAPIFDEAGFTSLSPSCSGHILTEQGFTSFHRLTNVNSVIAANSIRTLTRETGIQRLAILHPAGADSYYVGMARAAAAEFTALGGEVVLDLAYSEAWQPAQVSAEIIATGADAIYCACPADWASALLSLLEAPQRQLPFLSESHDWAQNLVTRLGAEANDVYFSSDYPYALPATRELAARYEERFGAAPYSPYFATAYDAYQLLLDAILAIGELDDEGALHIDRAALNAEIRSTSDYPGVTGPITCDENGECLLMPTAVLQIQEGEFVLLDVTLPEGEEE